MPFFFENEKVVDVMVNGKRYRAMLNEFLFPKIKEDDMDDIWFQQDGATSHTANVTINLLRTVFENRIISRNSDGNWPPQSCDLIPLDYFLWGVAIHGIEAQTIEYVLKNLVWLHNGSTDRYQIFTS